MTQLSLADTLPPIKRCACGVAYDADAWSGLPYGGVQDDGEGGSLELRHCGCGSTIAIEVPRPLASEPKPNSPADLGWTPQAVSRPARPTFVIPEGTRESACRSCRAPIYWIVTTAGRKMPVDPTGTSHFATCPEAHVHRRKRP